ncbi:hypothetical protein Leryth_005197 [Lithospermum erythrorhizon]|nr:hypothetical protein Leryth_005197 [Lithospermum erythrorhizon]
MDHVLTALRETEEERIQESKSLFGFFDSDNVGYLDYSKIEKGLSAMRIPFDYKFARELLNVCDSNKDGRVDYVWSLGGKILNEQENLFQRYWERVCLVDDGEQAVIPEGISNHGHASKYLIAGGVAGAASRTATAPLDRLKVTLQVQTTRAAIVPAVKKIWSEGRVRAFFRGNGLNIVKVAPESAIKFWCLKIFKTLLEIEEGADHGDI